MSAEASLSAVGSDTKTHDRSRRVHPSIDEEVYPSIQYQMSKSVRISEEFHEFVMAHKHEDETMEETLRRLIGGPHPEDVAGILSSETAGAMRKHLETKRETDVESKRKPRERFE